MNKEDLQAIEDLAELANGDNPGAASIELERRLKLVPADIARQLTIRNEQERHHAKRLHGIFEAIIEVMDEKPTPAPDALVEAVKKVIKYSKERHTHDGGGYIEMLQSALDAAHEKAVE